MRRVSMNARMAPDAISTDKIEVCLVRITHPLLDEPVRLSTDPTSRVSVSPLMYGTFSEWLTEDSSPFLFVLASAKLPEDKEDTPPQASFSLENVDNDIAILLRGQTDQATVDLAVVLASSPNVIEYECLGLKLISVDGNAAEVTLNSSLDPLTSEPYPCDRMTKQRNPGLHR